jgi:hypothetical protein
MKKTLLLFALLTLLFALSSCQYLNVPSFQLYVGYEVNPKSEIVPNDYALPKPRPEK